MEFPHPEWSGCELGRRGLRKAPGKGPGMWRGGMGEESDPLLTHRATPAPTTPPPHLQHPGQESSCHSPCW